MASRARGGQGGNPGGSEKKIASIKNYVAHNAKELGTVLFGPLGKVFSLTRPFYG